MSPRLISRCGRNGRVFPGAKINLFTNRWSPIVIVFCMDPVGTFTAWTMKVMPNRAMITVTTADSKYSRRTDFGGPLGFVSGCGARACPFRLKSREREKDFGSVFVSEALTEAGPLDGLFVISKIILDTLTAAVKFARSAWKRSGGHAFERIVLGSQAKQPT